MSSERETSVALGGCDEEGNRTLRLVSVVEPSSPSDQIQWYLDGEPFGPVMAPGEYEGKVPGDGQVHLLELRVIVPEGVTGDTAEIKFPICSKQVVGHIRSVDFADRLDDGSLPVRFVSKMEPEGTEAMVQWLIDGELVDGPVSAGTHTTRLEVAGGVHSVELRVLEPEGAQGDLEEVEVPGPQVSARIAVAEFDFDPSGPLDSERIAVDEFDDVELAQDPDRRRIAVDDADDIVVREGIRVVEHEVLDLDPPAQQPQSGCPTCGAHGGCMCRDLETANSLCPSCGSPPHSGACFDEAQRLDPEGDNPDLTQAQALAPGAGPADTDAIADGPIASRESVAVTADAEEAQDVTSPSFADICGPDIDAAAADEGEIASMEAIAPDGDVDETVLAAAGTHPPVCPDPPEVPYGLAADEGAIASATQMAPDVESGEALGAGSTIGMTSVRVNSCAPPNERREPTAVDEGDIASAQSVAPDGDADDTPSLGGESVVASICGSQHQCNSSGVICDAGEA